MDAGARARRDVLSARAAFLASVFFACAPPRARGGAPGVPALAAGGPPGRTQPEAALTVPADPAASLARLTPEGVRSRGHGGGLYQVTIFANPPGVTLWRERRGRAAPRALFVAQHQSVMDDSPGPVLLMQKHDPGYDSSAADWQFAWAEAQSTIVRSGRLADCAACHAGAETDYVFIIE
jgi:hypothetical protein